ncbi:hypothetical protein [Nitrosopumilus ureiphilus]|uniref:hypothetical protein n=1 Tax=Nitrosopumilus ureiphilus TaxID=1470067 RepID=UPI0015C6F5D2|nr:hypothetical protein [Nitrosopumilus ureiphilus]
MSYEKIKRISMPLEGGCILFVSVDAHEKVDMKYIMELVDYTLHKLVPLFPVAEEE